MATATNQERINAEVARLAALVQTDSDEVTAFGALIVANTAAITDLKAAIADLKAQNPDVDLTGFDSVAGQLDAANNQAAGIIASAQTPS